MKKHEKIKNTKRTYGSLLILLLIIVGGALIARAYFLNKPLDTVNIINNHKYNDPLEIANLPKFSASEDLNIFPSSQFESASTQTNQWLAIKTETSIQIGYFDQNLIFNQVHFLPINASQIKIYHQNKIFFVLDSVNGSGPRLIFKDLENYFEIIELNSNEYFTGYFYFPDERIFYISKGDSQGRFSLVTYSPSSGLTSAPLVQLENKFSILYADDSTATLDDLSGCKVFKFYNKDIQSVDCQNLQMNDESLNLKLASDGVYKSQSGLSTKIISLLSNQIISTITYKDKSLVYIISELDNTNSYQALSINESNLLAQPIEITRIFPVGEIRSVFKVDNNLLAVVKEQGIEKILKFNPEIVTSYPQDSWAAIQFTQELLINIELLGPEYFI